MATEPQDWAWNDSATSLWRRLSYNWWLIAVGLGYSEPLRPRATDNKMDAMRKSVHFTYFIALNQ